MTIPWDVINLVLLLGVTFQSSASAFIPKRSSRCFAWKFEASAPTVGADVIGENTGGSLVKAITDPDHFKESVDPGNIDNGDLIAIKFWAPWCRACKALEPKFARISQQYPNFRFMELNWEENRGFCKEIGVAALPLVRFYTSEGQVESFTCGPKKVELLRANLDKWQGQLDASLATSAAIPKAEDFKVSDLKNLCYPLMGHMDDERVQRLLDSAITLSYDDGDLIIEQDDTGHRFWVMLQGEVEVFKRSGYGALGDRSLWGTPVNCLEPGQYFGEHGLITGLPRWSTIVSTSPDTQCLVFEKSVLAEIAPEVWANESFVPSVWGINVNKNLRAAEPKKQEPKPAPIEKNKIPMIVRFRMLRQAVKAFEFAQRKTPLWGDPAHLAFRSTLVASLTSDQLMEFEQIFSLLDVKESGAIGSADLMRCLRLQGAIPENYPEAKLADMINKANPIVDGNTELTKADFVAMMAEAEYSNFFIDTFSMLDIKGNGWVSAPQMLTLLRELGEESETMFTDKYMRKTMEEFGMDEDGHIDYKAFVDLIMSTRSEADQRTHDKDASGMA